MDLRVKNILDNFSNTTNRSLSQTMFLYELCDCDFLKLVKLEEKILSLFLFYCPGDKDELEKILAMEYKKHRVILDEWKVSIDPNNRWTLIFKGDKITKMIAIPPTDGNRIDLIDCREGKEWNYHYNPKELFKQSLKVVIENGIIIQPII
jgi:hypothetical protein